MNRSIAVVAMLAAGTLVSAHAGVAHADTLKVQVRREVHMAMPTRGMTMAQVLKRFGQPERKLPVRGGGSRWQPPIHRWMYPGYIVYFERTIVIHSVADAPSGEHPVR